MNDNLKEREVFEAWAKENGYGNSMLKTHAKAGWDAAIEANTPAVPDCRVVDRGFRWDADRQEHVPTLVTEFDAVPLNSPYDAKGWTDRDALAAMLAAAPQPQPVAQPVQASECEWTNCPHRVGDVCCNQQKE